MKIVSLTTYIMESPGREYLFVKIQTDEGLHGWGEGTLEMKQGAVAATVRDLQDVVLGADPTRVDFLWQRLYRHGFWRGGDVVLTAISAIEQALWDITGKAYAQPVYKLLGGAVRDSIPCYTHVEDADDAIRLMDEGWRAFKFGPPWARTAVDERALVTETVRLAQTLRDAVGDAVELMCDAHGRLRPSLAIRMGRALEPYGLLFFEEPVPPDNIMALKNVRDATLGIDLATGERIFTKWGYRELIEKQLVDIIQPDLCHAGGIKETLKIAALAETYNILVAPHNPNGPVGTAVSVHLAACLPNFRILEYAISPTRDACQTGEPLKVVDGSIALPTAPGLGVELDEEYLRRNPWHGVKLWPGQYHADGAVADV